MKRVMIWMLITVGLCLNEASCAAQPNVIKIGATRTRDVI
jgi:hypothetical protein